VHLNKDTFEKRVKMTTEHSNFNIVRRLILLITVVFTCIMCDQNTKTAAVKHLSGSEAVNYGSLQLIYAENDAGLMGSGTALESEWKFWVFRYGIALFLILLVVYTISTRRYGPLEVASLALVIGGGSSNLIDRFSNNGMVIDFLNLRIGHMRDAVFNYADIAIVMGVFFLLSDRLSKAIARCVKRPPSISSGTVK